MLMEMSKLLNYPQQLVDAFGMVCSSEFLPGLFEFYQISFYIWWNGVVLAK